MIILKNRGERLENISRRLSIKLYRKGYIGEEKIEKIRFAIELCLTQIVTFTSIFLIGIQFVNLMEILLYLIVFISVKHYMGGYHAKTYIGCYILTILNTLVILQMSISFKNEIYCMVSIILAVIYIYIRGSVVESETKLGKAKYTRNGIIVTNVFCFISLGLMLVNEHVYSNIISNTLNGIVIMMEIEIKTRRRERDEKN
ncbi:accessory gene regulator B family protein [Amedibacillus sp. YH-ame6]